MNQPEVAPITKALDQAHIDAYARASGDFNPIHIDPDFARTTPYEGTIAHGMLVLATISEMMTGAFGDRWLAGGKLGVPFRKAGRQSVTLTSKGTPGKPEDG